MIASAVKSQERAVITSATAETTGFGPVPSAINFSLKDSRLNMGSDIPTNAHLLTHQNPLHHNLNTTTAFPPSFTGAVPLRQEQTAQILAAHYQRQQQILLQHQERQQQMQRAMALQQVATTAAPAIAVAQHGPPLLPLKSTPPPAHATMPNVFGQLNATHPSPFVV